MTAQTLPKAPVDLSMTSRGVQKIITQDAKYNMYINALPSVIRQNVFNSKPELNPRELYNEYRKHGKEHMIKKYSTPAKQVAAPKA